MTTTNTETIKATAKQLSDAVNIMGSGEKQLAAAFLADHRTLVQCKAAVFLAFFRQLAEQAEAGRTDARNEAAGKLAIVIRDAADAAGFGDGLPFI